MCKSKSNAYNPWVVNFGKASGHSTEADPVLFVPLWAEEHRMEDGAGHGQVGPDTTVKMVRCLLPPTPSFDGDGKESENSPSQASR